MEETTVKNALLPYVEKIRKAGEAVDEAGKPYEEFVAAMRGYYRAIGDLVRYAEEVCK